SKFSSPYNICRCIPAHLGRSGTCRSRSLLLFRSLSKALCFSDTEIYQGHLRWRAEARSRPAGSRLSRAIGRRVALVGSDVIEKAVEVFGGHWRLVSTCFAEQSSAWVEILESTNTGNYDRLLRYSQFEPFMLQKLMDRLRDLIWRGW